MIYDRHLNAIIIEPKLIASEADLEDHYFVSIIGNDLRVRAEFAFAFEQSGHNQSSASFSPVVIDRDEEDTGSQSSTPLTTYPL